MIPRIDQLVQRLGRIAKKNKDEFKYRVDIQLGRSGALVYSFVVTETADGHEFLTAQGVTVEGAVEQAFKEIDESCETWGYEEVE